MTSPIGVAILGCGYWGVNYVRVLHELKAFTRIAACDQRMDRLELIRQRFPDVQTTTCLDELLASDEIDAIVVCSEATSHYALTSRCLAAGKHVLVEKPLTTSSEDARALATMASQCGLTLMVAHTFIYNSAIRTVKRYVDQGRLGELYYLYACRTNLGPIRRDVNAIWDLATHDIAIFNYLLDAPPLWVSAVGAKVLRNCREDVGFVSLGYSDNVVGHVHVSWANPNKTREMAVVGSDRRVVFNDLDRLEPVRIFEKGIKPIEPALTTYGDSHFQMRDGDIISPRFESAEPLRTQCQHFVDCLTSQARPLTGGLEGHQVVAVLEAINHSIALGGAQVRVAVDHDDHVESGVAHTLR